MTDKPFFKLIMTKEVEGDKINVKVRVNDAAPDNPVSTPYTVSDMLVILQSLASLQHYFSGELSNILMGTIEIDKTAYPK